MSEEMSERESILIVDADESIAESLALVFEQQGYRTEMAGTGQEAIEKAQKTFFNVALVDLSLPDMDGTELIAPLKGMHPDMGVIVAIAYTSLDTAVEALNSGESAYILKPLNMNEVIVKTRDILKKQHMEFENRMLHEAVQQELIERRQAENELLRRVKFEELIATISTDFIGLSLDQLDVGIDNAIAAIAELSEVDRSYIALFDDHSTKMSITNEWCAEGIEPQKEHLQHVNTEPLAWSMDKLTRLETLHIPMVAELPPEASVEKDLFESQDIQSLILVPMTFGGTFAGFIGFDSVRTVRTWSADDISLLRMVGDIFANALIRKRADMQVARKSKVLDAINRVFRDVLTCETEEELIQTCLTVAKELSESKFGLFGELNEDGLFDTISINNLGWSESELPEGQAALVTKDMPLRGIYQATIRDGKPRIMNSEEADATRPDHVPTLKGYPKVTAFLGVPLKHEGKTIGMIGLGNKDGGYTLEDQENTEALSVAIVEAFYRKRAEVSLRESEDKFRTIFESVSDEIMYLDEDGTIIDVNSRVEQIFGWTRDEVIGRQFTEFDFVDPDVVSKITDKLSAVIGGKSEGLMAFQVRRKDGVKVFVEASTRLAQREGEAQGLLMVIRDITDRKRFEKAILQANKELNFLNSLARTLSTAVEQQEVLEAALYQTLSSLDLSVGVTYLLNQSEGRLDLAAYSGIVEDYAKACRTITVQEGSADDSALKSIPSGKNPEDLIRATLESLSLTSTLISPLVSRNKILGFICIATQDYREFSDDDARLLETVGREVGGAMERTYLLDQLRELSRTDDLTGLDNRRRFYEVIEPEISRATRYGVSSSLAMIDLDGFKDFNDRFGHSNGDALLKSFARTLRSVLRKSDWSFRYGGDEFVIILPSTSADKARRAVNRVRSAWENLADDMHSIDGMKLSFSAGIVQFPDDAESPDALIFLADTALYHSKRLGGAQSTVVSALTSSGADTLGIGTPDQVYALAATVDAKDQYTYGHSNRVANIASTIGKTIGLSQKMLVDLRSASLLHDIGKVGVPDAILEKPGKLADEEWSLIQKHSAEGARIVGYIRELNRIVPYILHHHEWFDGSGYPNGVAGTEIPLAARIISIADAYDTMTTDRTYRKAMSSELAIGELRRCSGTQFDPELVEAFCTALDDTEINTTDEKLSTS